MAINDCVRAMIEEFYLCTQIPVRSYSFAGILLHAVGYCEAFNQLFAGQQIYERITKPMITLHATQITVTCLEAVHFSGCWICARNIQRGFHIIGPYTSKRRVPSGPIPYKPLSCVPHLLDLLQDIALDNMYISQKMQPLSGRPYSLYVKRAIAMMNARYREPLSLEEIAHQLNISKSYFCTLFKKETGQTFSSFLNELRVEKSKKMLLEKDWPVLDIALSVGFNNQNYYNLVFKKLMRSTPLEFRRNRTPSA